MRLFTDIMIVRVYIKFLLKNTSVFDLGLLPNSALDGNKVSFIHIIALLK